MLVPMQMPSRDSAGAADPTRPRLAILDDYQSVATDVVDWSPLTGRVDVVAFADHLDDGRPTGGAAGAVRIGRRDAERTPVRPRRLRRLPGLRLLVTTGMRNKAIDLTAAAELGITVSGTDLVGASTVELTWALIMAVVRDLTGEDRRTRAGQWQRTLPPDLEGSTIGILGLGRLGARSPRWHRFRDERVAWSENLTAATWPPSTAPSGSTSRTCSAAANRLHPHPAVAPHPGTGWGRRVGAAELGRLSGQHLPRPDSGRAVH